MNDGNDAHLDVCQNIEVGIKYEYETNPRLTDTICIFALDNAKIAIKQQFGYAQNERVSADENARGIIDWCVGVGMDRINKINDLSLKEYVARIEKIKGSVAAHAGDGSRSYYHFVKAFLP